MGSGTEMERVRPPRPNQGVEDPQFADAEVDAHGVDVQLTDVHVLDAHVLNAQINVSQIADDTDGGELRAELSDREEPRDGGRSRDGGDYADVMVLFEQLHAATDERAAQRLRDQICARCLPMADNIARRYRGRRQDVEDLTQVARLGLIKAVTRFDPSKGSPFLAFAVPTMMGEVRRHFRDHTWAVHVPRGLKDSYGAINTAVDALSHTLGRAPTAAEVAAHLNLSHQDVVDALIAGQNYTTQSLDKPLPSRGDAAGQLIADSVGEIDGAFERITDHHSLAPLLAGLPERERTVLFLRFFESQSQTQIAERLGISQMHVSRILRRTLTELRTQLR